VSQEGRHAGGNASAWKTWSGKLKMEGVEECFHSLLDGKDGDRRGYGPGARLFWKGHCAEVGMNDGRSYRSVVHFSHAVSDCGSAARWRILTAGPQSKQTGLRAC
jgi:hypothetical protein